MKRENLKLKANHARTKFIHLICLLVLFATSHTLMAQDCNIESGCPDFLIINGSSFSVADNAVSIYTTALCVGTEITLAVPIGNYGLDNVVFQWYIGADDGSDSYDGLGSSFTHTLTGDTQFTLNIDDSGSCNNTELCILFDNVNPTPIISATPDPGNSMCDGEYIDFTLTGGTTYSWTATDSGNDISGEAIGTNQTSFADQTLQNDGSTSQTVEYCFTTASSFNCTSTNTECDTIAVHPSPSGALTGTSNACFGDPITVTLSIVEGSPSYSVTYTINGSSVDYENLIDSLEFTVSISDSNSTTIVLTELVDELGCSADFQGLDTLVIETLLLPYVELLDFPDSLCANENLIVSFQGTNNADFSFEFNDEVQYDSLNSSGQLSNLDLGVLGNDNVTINNFIVILGNCVDTLTTQCGVIPWPVPEQPCLLNPATPCSNAQSIYFEVDTINPECVNGVAIDNYIWSIDPTVSDTAITDASPGFNPVAHIDFGDSVTYTISVFAESDEGCLSDILDYQFSPDANAPEAFTIASLGSGDNFLLYVTQNDPTYSFQWGCTEPDSLISTSFPGEVFQSFFINQDSIATCYYWCEITYQGCTTISYYLNGLNVPNTITTELRIWPNPTSGILNITGHHLSQYNSVDLFNGTGVMVLSNEITNGTQSIEINMAGLSAGVYHIRLRGIHASANIKIVKE